MGSAFLRESAGGAFETYGSSVEVDYGAGKPAQIDGTVAGRVAVEIESRTGQAGSGRCIGPLVSYVSQEAPVDPGCAHAQC